MRKKDEMEQRMANKSAKITLFVTVTALFIIGGIEAFRNDMKTNILLVIAQFSVSLVILLERYYLSKANGDDSFKKTLILTLVLVIILLAILLGTASLA